MNGFYNIPDIASRRRVEESAITKKQKIMDVLLEEGLTEKAILQKVGDNRYTREIIRNLLQKGLICREGKVHRVCMICTVALC
jgi:hypothetical protein